MNMAAGMVRTRVKICLAVLALVAAQSAFAEKRVALVIGNGAYKSVSPLTNPRNDAAAVAGELTRLGFEVAAKYDLTIDRMREALSEFEDKATGADWGFVYYAGHGMELNGKNWLVPIDATLTRASDVADEAVPLERVLDRLALAKKLRIVVLDACRNNPFLSRMVMTKTSTRAVTRGLAGVEPSHGEVVFYAARDGNVALDGTGRNSPFAMALVKHMDEDGLELGRFFRKVTSTVMGETGNQQEPFVYGRIPDEDYFFKHAPGTAPASAAPPQTSSLQAQPSSELIRMQERLARLEEELAKKQQAALAPPPSNAVTSLTPPIQPIPTVSVEGEYLVRGTNRRGQTYSGRARIWRDGERYRMSWNLASGEKYGGEGVLNGDTLTINWGEQYPVIYAAGSDGVLHGTWANGHGTENLVRVK
jgi:Caspase domain